MRMSELVESVSRKAIPPWEKTLLVEVMVNDEEGEDVEVRLVFFLPPFDASLSTDSLRAKADLASFLSSAFDPQVPFCVISI